jgi:hypothetical protein
MVARVGTLAAEVSAETQPAVASAGILPVLLAARRLQDAAGQRRGAMSQPAVIAG